MRLALLDIPADVANVEERSAVEDLVEAKTSAAMEKLVHANTAATGELVNASTLENESANEKYVTNTVNENINKPSSQVPQKMSLPIKNMSLMLLTRISMNHQLVLCLKIILLL